eukprot:7469514-Pyramimonas_sp.AAC.1
MTTGTRPGNTLAAQLFLFIVPRCVRKTWDCIQEAGLHQELAIPNTRTLDPLAQCDAQVSANDVEHSDDSLFNAWGPAGEIVARKRALMAIVADSFTPAGLKINAGPTKSALMITFRGSGAVMARKQFWIEEEGEVSIPPTCTFPKGLTLEAVH